MHGRAEGGSGECESMQGEQVPVVDVVIFSRLLGVAAEFAIFCEPTTGEDDEEDGETLAIATREGATARAISGRWIGERLRQRAASPARSGTRACSRSGRERVD